MADTTSILNVQQVYRSPYHSEANGVIKWLNRTFTSMMQKFVNDELSNWDIFLPFINRAYNTCIHEVTHASPHYVAFGSDSESLIDRFLSFEGIPSDRTRWGDQMHATHDRVLNVLRPCFTHLTKDSSLLFDLLDRLLPLFVPRRPFCDYFSCGCFVPPSSCRSWLIFDQGCPRAWHRRRRSCWSPPKSLWPSHPHSCPLGEPWGEEGE